MTVILCTFSARCAHVCMHTNVVRGSPRRTTSCLPRWPVTAALLSTPQSTGETDRAQEAAADAGDRLATYTSIYIPT